MEGKTQNTVLGFYLNSSFLLFDFKVLHSFHRGTDWGRRREYKELAGYQMSPD